MAKVARMVTVRVAGDCQQLTDEVEQANQYAVPQRPGVIAMRHPINTPLKSYQCEYSLLRPFQNSKMKERSSTITPITRFLCEKQTNPANSKN
jgi:hypothetical protein